MRTKIAVFFALFLAVPFAAFAAREGTPVYYQNGYAPQYQQLPSPYAGQNVFVGNQPMRQVVGQRSYSYQVPRPAANPYQVGATMTPNGVSIPFENNPYDLSIKGEFIRRFADFQFETGVQSILEWDDMIINEIGLRVSKNFTLRDFNLFAFGEYSRGTMSDGGLSMDYDLKPYDDKYPEYGIFTISIGDQAGTTQTMKVGIGAQNIWDFAGWKLSPSIGYQIFKHDLTMSNHIYPNPPVYLPLMTQDGYYVFSNLDGEYFVVDPADVGSLGDDAYQVCMSPEDLALVATGLDPLGRVVPILDSDGNLVTTAYDPLYQYLPWGVNGGECVVVGGDGLIMVSGVTHIYNTTWSGIYIGLEVEKQMTYVDKLRFYFQISMPHYRSEGIWPNRTDWQQNPSFVDEGDTSAMHYQAEMEYIYQFSDRLQLSLKASMNYFHIGAVGGELYVAGYSYYETDSEGYMVCKNPTTGQIGAEWCQFGGSIPIIGDQAPYTEKVSDSLKYATWQSFGLHLGVKYAF